MNIVELLTDLFGASVIEQRTDATMSAVALKTGDGRRLILLERTYRDGLTLLLEPTDDDIEIIRSGDLWTLWNSKRAISLESIASWPPDFVPEKKS